MRLVWVVAILLVVAMAIDWAVEKGKEESQRLAEKPRSEKYIVGNLDRGKGAVAAISVHDYKSAFIQYKLTKNANPKSLKDLVDAGYLPGGSELDPFRQPYELKYEGREAIISSPGEDRVRGTPDDRVERVVIE